MKKSNDEPKVWVTVLKLVIGVAVIVGGVGFALWYAQGMDSGGPGLPSPEPWGISKDSPVRMKR
jgi:nitrate reductase NapE component